MVSKQPGHSEKAAQKARAALGTNFGKINMSQKPPRNPLMELINPTKKIDSIRHYEVAVSCRETRNRYKIDIDVPIADATNPSTLKSILIEKFAHLMKTVLR